MRTCAEILAAAPAYQHAGLVWLLWPDGRQAVMPRDLFVDPKITTEADVGEVQAFLEGSSFLRALDLLRPAL